MKAIERKLTVGEQINATPELMNFDSTTESLQGDWLARMAAGIRQENSLTGIYDSFFEPAWAEKDEDFAYWDKIPEDMSAHADLYRKANSQSDIDRITRGIKAEEQRKKLLQDGGWAGFFGQVIGTLGSPEFLPTLLWNPVAGGIGRTALSLGLVGATEEAVHETLLHKQQYTRDPYESLVRVGAAAAFGGIIGAGIGALTRPTAKVLDDEFRSIAKNDGVRQMDEIPDEIPANDPRLVQLTETGAILSDELDEAGAAATRALRAGADDAPVRAPRIGSGGLAAIRPTLKARVPFVHKLLNDTFGHDLQVGYNSKVVKITDPYTGEVIREQTVHVPKTIALSRKVDREVMQYQVAGYNAIREGFVKYVNYKGTGVGPISDLDVARMKNRGQYEKFSKEVRIAMSNNDEHVNPIVRDTARKIREEVYNPIERAARDVELLENQELSLMRRIENLERRIEGISNPEKVGKWNQRLQKAREELAEVQAAVDEKPDVKFALSYMNRRYNVNKIKDQEGAFKEALFNAFVDERAKTAFAEARRALDDKIEKLEEKLSQRPWDLDKKEAKLVKKIDSLNEQIKNTKKPEQIAKTVKELQEVERQLEKARKPFADDAILNRWEDQVKTLRSDQRALRADRDVELRALSIKRDKLKAHKARLVAKYAIGRKEAEISKVRKQIDEVKADYKKRLAKVDKEVGTVQGKIKKRKAATQKKRDDARSTIKKLEARKKRLEGSHHLIRKMGALLKAQRDLRKLGKKQADDPVAKGMQDEIDALRLERENMNEISFRRSDEDFKAEIWQNVNDSFRRIVSGELNSDFMGKGGPLKHFKERQLPIDDNTLLKHDWLETDMLDQIKAYTNTTVRPVRMIEQHGDIEMHDMLDELIAAYDDVIDNALRSNKPELARELNDELEQVMESMTTMRDRYYGRSQTAAKYANVATFARAIRNWNVMRMMGGVLLTSLNDVMRTRAARMIEGGMGPGTSMREAFKTAKFNKEAYTKVGIAHEMVSMMRLSRYVDISAEPVFQARRGLQQFHGLSTRGSKALMRATLLAEWTDHMKAVSAAMIQNESIRMMRNYANLSSKNKTILAEMGIGEEMAGRVMKQFDQYGDRFGRHGTSLNWDEWDDIEAAEFMKDVLFRQSERILVTPRESDLPVWADTELARSFLQFKSFSLAAHNQITLPMIERIKVGDWATIQTLAPLLVGAYITEATKVISARGPEAGLEELKSYNAADLALAVTDRSGVLTLYSMAFNNVDLLSGNRITDLMGAMPTSRFSDRATLGAFGPTAGTFGDYMRLSAALADGFDARDARLMRRAMPFNNFAPVHYPLTKLEEAITGEPAYRARKEE